MALAANRQRVAVVGSYGVGLSMWAARWPNRGETVMGRDLQTGHGGKGSNQAVQAARLGAQVTILTRIGMDSFGAGARSLWADEGIDASGVLETPGVATMCGFILVDDDGDNRIVIDPGALAGLTPDDVRAFRPAIDRSCVLLTQLEIPLPAVAEALRLGRLAGATTILNPAPAAGDSIVELLRNVDVLTPNQGEAAALAGLPVDADPERVARHLFALGPGAVICTLGERGALIVDDGGARLVPAPRARVVDTTGAGDAFNGALAYGLSIELDLDAAAALGCAAGSHAAERAGVVAGLARPSDLGDAWSNPIRH